MGKLATEVSNYGFEVERCAHKRRSAKSWEKIGFVRGNVQQQLTKELLHLQIDTANLPANTHIRLKQVDNDGQFEYSKTIEVDFGGSHRNLS